LVIGFVLYTAAAVIILLSGQTDQASSPDTKADVIIVLGAGVSPNGQSNDGQTRRTRHGAYLYRNGNAPFVLCTGGYDTPQHVKTEAEVCAEILEGNGVPASAILMDEKSMSTEENAIESHKVMDAHHLKTAILVTDNFHMARASMLFHAYNVSFITSPAQASTGPLNPLTAMWGSYREVGGFAWYAVKSLLHLQITDSPF
jgi:uncharacterized SAM-binding protein YcdF (DUF218 family)